MLVHSLGDESASRSAGRGGAEAGDLNEALCNWWQVRRIPSRSQVDPYVKIRNFSEAYSRQGKGGCPGWDKRYAIARTNKSERRQRGLGTLAATKINTDFVKARVDFIEDITQISPGDADNLFLPELGKAQISLERERMLSPHRSDEALLPQRLNLE